MPAASLSELFQFEHQFAEAAVGVLEANGYSDIYVRGTNDAVHDTGTMLWCDISGADTETLGRITGPSELNGRPEFFGYTCTLSVMRIMPSADNSDFPETTSLVYDAGKLRSIFLNAAIPFNADNLPYISVDSVQPLAAQWGKTEVGNLDALTLSWSLSFSIRPNAWPTV